MISSCILKGYDSPNIEGTPLHADTLCKSQISLYRPIGITVKRFLHCNPFVRVTGYPWIHITMRQRCGVLVFRNGRLNKLLNKKVELSVIWNSWTHMWVTDKDYWKILCMQLTAIYRRPAATYLQKEYSSKVEYCMYLCSRMIQRQMLELNKTPCIVFTINHKKPCLCWFN